MRFQQVQDPTREQQQATADAIFSEIRALYAGLDAEGRAGVIARVRAQRRARRSKGTATA
jgi:hypothetical protein